ncbi:MAG: flagellar basal-body MS-ring/collar protein FliF, partial [Bryobacteraceae bacterium]
DGTTILVPEDRVAELRLDMAGAGLPKSGRIGFEIFDKTNFGVTDFAEKVNFQRALEGELERSVMVLSEVEQARVHISFPQESVYTDKREPAKASVLVKLRSQLPDTAIPAITHLISSAVEGLSPDAVAVLDMRGNLLSKPKRQSGQGDDTSATALEYRHAVDQDLTTKLDSTLEPLVGAGRFRAAVSADTDLTSAEQSEENYDPTHSVMVASQKTEDLTTSPRATTGVPGTASNVPDEPTPRPVAPGPQTSRKSENINYQTSRVVKRTVLPQGTIKRLSISVLIDQEVHFEGTGADAKRVLTPPTPERLKVIHDLVAGAVGFNEQRGDQLIVESLPFESTQNLEASEPSTDSKPALQLTVVEQLKKNPKMLYGTIGGAVVVLVGVVFLFTRLMKKPEREAVEVTQVSSLPPASAEPNTPRAAVRDQWAPSLASSSLPALSPARVEVLATQIRETAQKDAEAYAGVLRGWLREGQG